MSAAESIDAAMLATVSAIAATYDWPEGYAFTAEWDPERGEVAMCVAGFGAETRSTLPAEMCPPVIGAMWWAARDHDEARRAK